MTYHEIRSRRDCYCCLPSQVVLEVLGIQHDFQEVKFSATNPPEISRSVCIQEDRKQMHLCSCMLNSSDCQTEASVILNYVVWEHAGFIGFLVALYLWKLEDRYTTLLILEHTSPKRDFSNLLFKAVWMPRPVALYQH